MKRNWLIPFCAFIAVVALSAGCGKKAEPEAEKKAEEHQIAKYAKAAALKKVR